MPLNDLIRYFNTADSAGDSMLYPEGERAAAWHQGLRLGSLFQPIVDLRQERIVGHQATLAARREDGAPVSGEAAYALCESAEAVVHFDRLCRTLHALNFLAQRRYAGGYLQLPIHPRHLLAVQSQHGLVYEAILKRCGLAPEDIALDIDASRLGGNPHLAAALGNYRRRGYRLALREPAVAGDLAALVELKPEVIRLAAPAPELLQAARCASIAAELAGIDTGHDLEQARAAGVELGLGKLFGEAAADCRATHSERRVAYNSASPSGVPP
ncbi:MAG TPA: EAL domain-containing protein [Azonexus sp.]|nr:EAL domain-containing protein [Azonexus sp.]